MSWFQIAVESVVSNPQELILTAYTADGLVDVVGKIILKYKDNVENNGLWKEFYREDDGRAKHERFGQLLFYAVADAYCDANNLDISRESNGGNGPVDFKLSQGTNFKYLVEMKLSSNPKLLDGFTVQLDAYKASEKTRRSAYVVVRVNGRGNQLEELIKMNKDLKLKGQACPDLVIIDATDKESASKRKRDRP